MKVPKARKLPSGKWFIQLRLGGESIPITDYTEKDCTRQAQIVKAEYLAGKRAPTLPEPEKLPTLREASKNYIKSRILSPSTERGYNTYLKSHLQELLDISLSDLTPQDYQAAIKEESKVYSAKTIKNAWGFYASVISDATGQPAPKLSLPQVIPNEQAFLPPEEITLLMQAAKGSPYEIPILLALSSMRRSEILGLQWENVDLKHRRIHVRGAVVYGPENRPIRKPENKNRSSTRYVSIMMDQLYDALKAAQKPSGPVVEYSPPQLIKGLKALCAAAEISEVGNHGLRHSFASLAYHLEVPDQMTMELGGWSDPGTMRKIYTHIGQMDAERYKAKFAPFFNGESEENANKNAN